MRKIYLFLILILFLQLACFSARTETQINSKSSVGIKPEQTQSKIKTEKYENTSTELPSKAKKNDDKLDRELLQAILKDDLGGVIATIEQGANVNASGDFEKIGKNITALNLAVPVDEEMVDVLMEKGANPNKFSDFYVGSTKDTRATSPLMQAAAIGKISVVKILIKRGADLNFQNKNGDSPLMSAVSHTGILKLLLEKGANPNQANSEGVTPLMAVVQGARYDKTKGEKVNILLQKGADLNAKDKNGRTALDIARSYGDKELSNLLENKK